MVLAREEAWPPTLLGNLEKLVVTRADQCGAAGRAYIRGLDGRIKISHARLLAFNLIHHVVLDARPRSGAAPTSPAMCDSRTVARSVYWASSDACAGQSLGIVITSLIALLQTLVA